VKWIAIVAGGLMLVVAGIAAIGSLLPRNHKASRTLRLTLPPADVWPVLIQATEASDVPVDVLERDPPRRLVTRVTEKEKNFGGTWTITIAPTPSGSDVTITEDGWVANPIFRFASRFIIGHHATMDALLKQVAKTLNEPAALSGA
jgi:membrane-associated PAP2 superfamily phosphatase